MKRLIIIILVFERIIPLTLVLPDEITTIFEKGPFTGMILIDLQKAFATINHQILIKKIKDLGLSENIIAWFKSYLSE